PRVVPNTFPMVSPCPQVLFTGVVASPGMEVALKTLGGSMATSVFDCTHLVTDRVRRTVKFLCAVARGVPIVTPEWLHKVPRGQGTGEGRPWGPGEGPRGQGMGSLGTWDGIFGDRRVQGDMGGIGVPQGTVSLGTGVQWGHGMASLGTWTTLGTKERVLGDKGGVLGHRGVLGDRGWGPWGHG
ncbi:MDC1 protein, partial [Balaeniceps rex]|nr:MDC1 protein [Balaeniceps rex]